MNLKVRSLIFELWLHLSFVPPPFFFSHEHIQKPLVYLLSISIILSLLLTSDRQSLAFVITPFIMFLYNITYPNLQKIQMPQKSSRYQQVTPLLLSFDASSTRCRTTIHCSSRQYSHSSRMHVGMINVLHQPED